MTTTKTMLPATIANITAAADAAGLCACPVLSTHYDGCREVHVYGDGQCMGSLWGASGRWVVWKAPRQAEGRWSKAATETYGTLGEAVHRLRPGKRIAQ
jgi:hypothetical protein